MKVLRPVIVWAPLNTLTLSRLKRRVQDQGFALFYLNFDIGYAIGTVAVIGVQVRSSQISHAELGAFVTPFNELLRHPGLAGAWDIASAPGLAALQGEIGRQATMIGYNNAFMAIAVTMAVLLPFIACFRHPRREPLPDD